MFLPRFFSSRFSFASGLGYFFISLLCISSFFFLISLYPPSVLGESLSGEAISGESISGEALLRERPVRKTYITESDAPFFFARFDRDYSPWKTFWQDTSLERFVTKNIPLSQIAYAPDDLIPLSGGTIDEAGRHSYMREEAKDALEHLARDFEKEFSRPLIVVSGYRSAAYQKRLWDLGRCTDTLCAPPGYSEHQLGLAIDIFDASTAEAYMKNSLYRKYITWIQDRAQNYGFSQSYQNGPNVDGYDIEPWHWRYLRIPLATKLKKLDMSYSEYIEFESMLAFWKR